MECNFFDDVQTNFRFPVVAPDHAGLSTEIMSMQQRFLFGVKIKNKAQRETLKIFASVILETLPLCFAQCAQCVPYKLCVSW